MQQNFGFRELTKTVLTITGLLLLVIFGTRAASQASSIAAVRGEPTRAVFGAGVTLGKLQVLPSATDSLSSAPSSGIMGSKSEAEDTAVASNRPDDQAKQLLNETKAKLKNAQENVENSITGVAATYEKSERLLKTDVK